MTSYFDHGTITKMLDDLGISFIDVQNEFESERGAIVIPSTKKIYYYRCLED